MTHPARFLTCILSLGLLLSLPISLSAQEAAKDNAQILKIYSLSFLDAESALKAVQPLLAEKDHVAAEVRTNSIIARGPAEMHQQLEALLLRLDAEKSDSRVVLMPVTEKPSDAVLEAIHLIGNGSTDFTYDDSRSILILRGREADVQQVQEVVRELQGLAKAGTKPSTGMAPFMLRIVWMETGDSSSPSPMMTPDLAEAVAPLGKVGISNLVVRSQVIVNVGTPKTKIETAANIQGDSGPQMFEVRGTVEDGSLSLNLALDDATQVSASVSLKEDQWVVLGAVGGPSKQTVFAIQRMK